jgi:MGT family glycosyltransferase
MTKAVFYNIPASGHVNPSLPVVAELTAAGEQIIYYAAGEHRRQVEATGAVFRPYTAVPDDYFYVTGLDGSRPPTTALALAQTTRAALPALLRQAREDKPDYVIYDSMCPWGRLVAQALAVPSISSSTFMIFTPSLILRTPAMFGLLAGTLKGLPDLRRYFRVMAGLAREHDVRPIGYPEIFALPGNLVINYTSALLQPGSRRLAARVSFVGPSIGKRAAEPDFPFGALDGRPLVYVSLGTVNNGNPAFFRAGIAAYQQMNCQVVMSVGQHVNAADLGEIPGNIIVRPQVPQLALLERAAVFVNHAGMNSVQEALCNGVPLITVPQSPEQAVIARQVARLGAAAMLTRTRVTPQRLRAVTERVLAEERYRRSAQRLGDEIKEAGGYRRAAREILAVTRNSRKERQPGEP